MRNIFFILFFLQGIPALSQGQKTETAIVSFTIRHALGSTADGSFKGFTGNIIFDPQNLAQVSMKASIDVKTIDTGLGLRDKTLRGSTYFDIEKYPKISMVSTKVEKGLKENEYTGYFNLTIKKTTKSIKVPFVFIQTGTMRQFKSTFKVNRLEYELGEKSSLLGDVATVSITLNVQ